MNLRWTFAFLGYLAVFPVAADTPVFHQKSVAYGNPALSQTRVLGSAGQDQEAQFIFCDTDGSCDFFGESRTLSPRSGLLIGRLDSTGRVARAGIYDPKSDYVEQVIRSADGAYLMTIDTRNDFGGPPANGHRGLILKLSREGTPVWATSVSIPYGDDTVADVHSIVQAHDGSLIVTGECRKGHLDDERDDVAVLKLTSAGKPLWSYCYRFEHDSFAERVQIRADGNIVLNVTYMINGQFDDNSVLFFLSPYGTPLQAKQFSIDEGTFFANELFARPDGSLIVTGGLSTRRTEVQDRGVFIRMDAENSVKTARSYEVAGEFQPYESVVLPEGVALLGGSVSYKPYSNSAVALLVDEDGQPRAAVVGTLLEPGTNHTTYNDFEGIAERPGGQYLLLGSTPAFNDDRNLEMLTTLWTPTSNSTAVVTPGLLHAKLVPVPLPKGYAGVSSIDSIDVGHIDILDVTPKK